jgi:hypothetical protein
VEIDHYLLGIYGPLENGGLKWTAEQFRKKGNDIDLHLLQRFYKKRSYQNFCNFLWVGKVDAL